VVAVYPQQAAIQKPLDQHQPHAPQYRHNGKSLVQKVKGYPGLAAAQRL
jgi:hypothetical protein